MKFREIKKIISRNRKQIFREISRPRNFVDHPSRILSKCTGTEFSHLCPLLLSSFFVHFPLYLMKEQQHYCTCHILDEKNSYWSKGIVFQRARNSLEVIYHLWRNDGTVLTYNVFDEKNSVTEAEWKLVKQLDILQQVVIARPRVAVLVIMSINQKLKKKNYNCQPHIETKEKEVLAWHF
jgi:hypothetical protein